jgi:hypothetical protein
MRRDASVARNRPSDITDLTLVRESRRGLWSCERVGVSRRHVRVDARYHQSLTLYIYIYIYIYTYIYLGPSRPP